VLSIWLEILFQSIIANELVCRFPTGLIEKLESVIANQSHVSNRV
jgi:hypothetical protein